MTRRSRRELERAVTDLGDTDAAADAVPLVVPSNALPEDHPDRAAETDDLRRTEDGDPCDLQVPYHRPRGLFGDAIPLITEAGIVRLWRSLPAEIATAERELRHDAGEPVPAALGGEADA